MRFKIASIVLFLACTNVPAAVIYTDNFNINDTNSLDGSDQTGRHAGLLANNVVGRSGGIQHTISGGQLNLLTPNAGNVAGRMRFHDAANVANRWDFATGAAGAQILADGGMNISFDWTSADNTSGNWISFAVGIPNDDAGNLRVINASTDSGILFRNSGGTQLFDNGVASNGGAFAVTSLTHHVDIAYRFNSFADGTSVTMTAVVDGTTVATQTFDWNGNAGTQFIEMGNVASGTRIDNFAITTIPEPTLGLIAAGALVVRRRRRR